MKILYPTHFNEYRTCPQRYYLRRVARQRGRAEGFSRALQRGGATHTVLAHCFRQFRDDRSFPIDLVGLATVALNKNAYPAGEQQYWQDDLVEVVKGAKYALSWFDGAAEVLAVESELSYPVLDDPDGVPYVLRARTDLVLRHPADASIEVIDFKTGQFKRDPVQELVITVVAFAMFGIANPSIRTTTIFASEGRVVSEVLDRQTVKALWGDLQHDAQAMLTGSNTSPFPTPLCEWCPFFGNGCSITEAPPAAVNVSAWLR